MYTYTGYSMQLQPIVCNSMQVPILFTCFLSNKLSYLCFIILFSCDSYYYLPVIIIFTLIF